ncbi:MAG: MBL fold metallo-hydrolase, partial [Pirellulales bacterium]|nr:MBL fold metallo-hydrolase [Pirellulales bacterium]
MPRLPAVQRFLTSEGKRIYRIPFKWLPGVTGRVYLVLGAGPPTLVDTGCGRGVSTRNILDGIETVRREFGEPVGVGDLGRILLTHGHIDHSDGLGELLRQCGAEVGIHPADAPAVRWPVEYEERSRAALARFFQRAGVPDERTGALALPRRRADATLGTSVELALEDGLLLDGLRIIHTPGHSPGHVVIVADDVLLCGDHILPHTAPQQTPEHVTPGGGLRRYLESLDKVQQAGPFRVGLGGHEPVIDDVDHRIDVLRQWQLRRNDDLVDVLEEQARPSTIWEVCRVVYRQTEGVFLLFALLDTAARLEFLGEEGRVELKEDGVGSSWRFSSAGSPHPRPLSQRERGEA